MVSPTLIALKDRAFTWDITMYSHVLPRALGLCGEMLTVPAGQWAVCLLNALSLERGQRFCSFTTASPSLGLTTTTAPVTQTVSMRKENLLHTILIVAKEIHSLTPNYLIYWSNSQPFFRQWMHLSPPSPRAKVHRKSLEMLSPASGIKLHTKEVQVQVRLGLCFRGGKIHPKEIYDHFKYSTARSSHGSKAVLIAGSYNIN